LFQRTTFVVAISKAAGTTAPRFHKYKVSTNVWTHENAGATIADPTTPSQGPTIGGIAANANIELGVVGLWNVVLSDAQIEALPFSLSSWRQIGPSAMWLFDQQAIAQKIRDMSGGGANEATLTGTSVSTSSVPLLSYGAPMGRVQIQPAAVGGGGAAGPRDLLLLGAG
jgi:hypothetical protein